MAQISVSTKKVTEGWTSNPKFKVQPLHHSDTFLNFESSVCENDFRAAFDSALELFKTILRRDGNNERAFRRLLEIVKTYDEEIYKTIEETHSGCTREYYDEELKHGESLSLKCSVNFSEAFDHLFNVYKYHLSRDNNFERAVYRIVEKIAQYDTNLGEKMRVVLRRNFKDRGLHKL